MSEKSRTWLITGCSTGLGHGLVEALIPTGDTIVATARNTDALSELATGRKNVRIMKLDVTAPEDNRAVVQRIEQELGGVDVLVNNAGHGYAAAAEEADEAIYRAMFETNFFGLADLTRCVLPAMRQRKRGHVVNISAVGGMVANPGSAFYAATKFAVVGFSEALSKEVAPLGIHVTVVAPGPFRTDAAGRSLKTTNAGIDAYEEVHRRIAAIAEMNGKQDGDPRRAGEAIIAAVSSEKPPLHLVLGAYGLDALRKHFVALGEEFDTWEALSRSADFPKGE
jgi:NAD(P)-dependent dehydrogenase (short-subunit alcohol dehydrogenase family)